MIVGVGIDLVDLGRIEKIYKKFGLRFCRHILAAGELATCPCKPVAWLGARFAAKEAAVKALGTGFSHGIMPNMVETATDPAGKPLLILHGNALLRAGALGAARFHLSLTHEKGCAAAIVILED